jgi:mRNA interferase RelE/StbE
MVYEIELKPGALKDLRKADRKQASKIADGIERLAQGLQGDVKKLTNFSPEFRLRIGQYRVLFDMEGRRIVIYRIVKRDEAYRS